LEGVKIYYKTEDQVTCTKIILNNINAKMTTHSSINDNISSAVIFSTPEFIKHSVPFLHGKLIYLSIYVCEKINKITTKSNLKHYLERYTL